MLYARVRVHALSLILLLICWTAVAQVGSARLEGVVRDASDAIVPGATATIVNVNTRITSRTITTSDGTFIFPSLQPGPYTLSIEAAGFRKTVISDLEVTVGATVVQNVKLEIGAITASVVVQADAERTQQADAQIGQAVTLRDIDSLPQVSRAPILLGTFNPGINVQHSTSGTSVSVNGSRDGSTNSKLDGIDVNDSVTPRFGLSTTGLNMDSVEEFRIVASGGKAEYGRNAGAQIELITRSGSNTWHGNAFEYLRNTVLNANDFFGNSSHLPRPVFIQNRFGASVGGPILHDRTFIFGNFQGLRTSQQQVRNRIVLTPEAKKGLFRWRAPGSSAIEDPFDIVSNDPRGIGIDPQVDEILALLPDPNNDDIGDGLNTAGYIFNNPATRGLLDGDEDQITIKADHNFWNGHHAFFRYSWGRNTNIDGANDARFPGQPNALSDIRVWGFSFGSDWAITPRLVNELRIGYKYYLMTLDRRARLPGPMLLANSWTNPLNPAFSNSREPPVSQITDNVTIARSKHVFKMGIEARFVTEWRSNDSGIWPDITFRRTDGNNVPPSIGPSGDSISPADRRQFEELYNDLLGRMNQVIQTFYSDLKSFQPAETPRVRNHRFREFGWFFQDDWKLHPRLTLNLGLRYEFLGAPVETNGIQGTVDKAALIGSNARIDDLTIQPSDRWYQNDFNNFAPRVGLAWDVKGDGKTVVRANWGIFYDRIIGATTSKVDSFTPGFSLRVPEYPNLQRTDIRVSDGIPVLQPPSAPELHPPATRTADLFLFSPNLRTGYVEHYSLSIQREIFRNTVIDMSYVGSHGIKLFMDINFNQPRIYEDFLAAFRELQAFRASGTPVPASNTLVRIFGSTTAAITAITPNTIDLGAVGDAAENIDNHFHTDYAAAGVSDFYLRNFPQFKQVVVGSNDGRSYYDSLQLSLRRQAGALRFLANYTYSRSRDNISAEGFGFTSPIDNFNIRLNRAPSDFDIPHVFNSRFMYTLPVGRGQRLAGNSPRWLDSLIGDWDIGILAVWQSGRAITYQSGIPTGPTTGSSFANYAGDRGIGRVLREADGVYWLTEEERRRFSFPAAGEIGTGGRNAFRSPRFFNVDISLVKRFKIDARQGVSFRAEAYNLFNNVNFAAPDSNMSDKTFGRISETLGNPRFLQLAVRYDF